MGRKTWLGIAAPSFLAVAAAMSSAALAQDPEWRCDRSPLAVTNATLWNDGRPLRRREIVVVDGRIVAIGRAGRLRRPAGSRVVDARGGWLLPGLIDSHAHFGRAGSVPAELLPRPYPGAWGVTGRQTLASGVTTVRISLSDFERGPAWARAAEDDCDPSPRIVLGGRGLMGGAIAPDAQIPGVTGVEDAREKVRANARAGAQWLAIYETHRFAPAELAAIIDESRRTGLSLMMAGGSFDEAMAGLEAGARTIEYVDQSAADHYPDPLIGTLRARGAAMVVPIGFYSRYVAYRRDPGLIDSPVNTRFETPGAAAALIASTRLRFETPPPGEQSLVDNFPAFRAKFRQLLEAGVAMVVGSDSGSQGHFHSDAIWWELRGWRDNGATIGQALAAATSRPADMLSLPDRGRLRVGARGDFLIYDRDLNAGDLDLAGVRAVAKGGVLHVQDGRWIGLPVAGAPQ